MRTDELSRLLRAADPVDHARLRRVDLGAMEADLVVDLDLDPSTPARYEVVRSTRARPHRLAFAFGTAAIAIVVAALVLVLAGGSQRASRAYGAELIRFAEATPLLLLEGPDWRVKDVNAHKTREGNEGTMEFVTGKPIPYGNLKILGNAKKGEHVIGLAPASERRRQVLLEWRPEDLAAAIANQRAGIHPHGRHFVRLPVLGTTAVVDTRAEIYVNQGGPHDREMVAVWSEGGEVLTLRADVPGLAAMEERLGWLTRVDAQTWLEAMPPKVVKAADHEGTVRAMLKGVPLPKSFGIARIPDEGLTTSREEVASQVAGTVACLWLRQWGAARRDGDEAAEAEAERALASSHNWQVLREMGSDSYPGAEIHEVAEAMPWGYWVYQGHGQNLLAHAESIGCARLGLPLLPEKMERQRGRGPDAS